MRRAIGYYTNLWATKTILPSFQEDAGHLADRILVNLPRYTTAVKGTGVPVEWLFLAHAMEASCDFTKQIFNGGNLRLPVQAGAMTFGPWKTWEASVREAISWGKLSLIKTWDFETLFSELEEWNGWGYAFKGKASPYICSGLQAGIGSGKYISDGSYDSSAVSTQPGAMCILARVRALEQYIAETPAKRLAAIDSTIKFGVQDSTTVKGLQTYLNTYFGRELNVDGDAGPVTADAFKAAFGVKMLGDLR